MPGAVGRAVDRAGHFLAVGRELIAAAFRTEEMDAVDTVGKLAHRACAVVLGLAASASSRGTRDAGERTEVVQAGLAVVLRPGQAVVGQYLVPVLRANTDHGVSSWSVAP